MKLIAEIRRRKRQSEANSRGQVAGLYLKCERRSKFQFEPTFLGNQGHEYACGVLDKVLDRLYVSHGVNNVKWYIERSHGLDIEGKIAWDNLDITEQIIP